MSDQTEAPEVGLTLPERRLLADRVLGGAEPSLLMVRAVEAIVAAREAAAEARGAEREWHKQIDYAAVSGYELGYAEGAERVLAAVEALERNAVSHLYDAGVRDAIAAARAAATRGGS